MKRVALWIIDGPNGAGKTTLASHPRFRRLLTGVHFLNPDQLTLEKLRALGRSGFHDSNPEELRECFTRSADEVQRALSTAETRRESIGVESVLSTPKYHPLVEHVLADKGFFGLIYVGLRSADLSRERIARRVAQGGHDVPPEKLGPRWTASIENLPWFVDRATRFWIFDNSDSTPGNPLVLIAEGAHEKSIFTLRKPFRRSCAHSPEEAVPNGSSASFT